MTVFGLLKSGELRFRHTIEQGDFLKLLGEWYEKFSQITKKFFSTERGRFDHINSQEVARPQNFVMGNDATELEFVELRSFLNRVND